MGVYTFFFSLLVAILKIYVRERIPLKKSPSAHAMPRGDKKSKSKEVLKDFEKSMVLTDEYRA